MASDHRESRVIPRFRRPVHMVVGYAHMCGPSKREKVQNPVHGFGCQALRMISCGELHPSLLRDSEVSCKQLGEISCEHLRLDCFSRQTGKQRYSGSGILECHLLFKLKPVSGWTSRGKWFGQRVGVQVLEIEKPWM